MSDSLKWKIYYPDKTFSNLNRWNYEGLSDVCYGEEIVYKKIADFVGDSCEDWGCGMGWLRYSVKNYKGIDGSVSSFISEPIDLVYYTSSADNIVLRQVLEHNYDWRKIVENAVKSFKKKLCITIHTPLSDNTHVMSVEPSNEVPDISFKLDDIIDYFKDCKIGQEFVPTNFEYDDELILYIEKNDG